LARSEIESLGLVVVLTDDEHGYIDGLPPFTENPSDENYNRANEAADKLLEIANRGGIIHDHWRRDD
jgi:hypothetical protein